MLTEHEKARLWRKAMGLTKVRLSELTGYSVSIIADMENGFYRQNGNPIPDRTWQRYKMACAAVTADVSFNWYRAEMWGMDISVKDASIRQDQKT